MSTASSRTRVVEDGPGEQVHRVADLVAGLGVVVVVQHVEHHADAAVVDADLGEHAELRDGLHDPAVGRSGSSR